jgi:hypothetical protein
MKRKKSTGSTWRCDSCGVTADTLYFAGKLNICGDCRDEDRRRSTAVGDGHSETRLAGAAR